jgi:putative heme-binding domain-containing protein
LTLKGDATHGEALFAEHCATCHRVGAAKVGHDIGPNLLTVRDWPTENLLTALLDPDRNVEPRFVAYTADLTDGTTLTGLLTGESAGNVIVKTLDDQDHSIPRSALKSLTSTERSLMPQGFESALSEQDVADLMTFLRGPTTGE